MLRILKSHLYLAKERRQTLNYLYFKSTEMALLFPQLCSGDGNRLVGLEPAGCSELAVLRLEMGTALARVGLMLGIGSPDICHVLPHVFPLFRLRRWTVSESCHEGLHHHF